MQAPDRSLLFWHVHCRFRSFLPIYLRSACTGHLRARLACPTLGLDAMSQGSTARRTPMKGELHNGYRPAGPADHSDPVRPGLRPARPLVDRDHRACPVAARLPVPRRCHGGPPAPLVSLVGVLRTSTITGPGASGESATSPGGS